MVLLQYDVLNCICYVTEARGEAWQDPDKLNALASSLAELLTLDQEDMTSTPSGTELGKLK